MEEQIISYAISQGIYSTQIRAFLRTLREYQGNDASDLIEGFVSFYVSPYEPQTKEQLTRLLTDYGTATQTPGTDTRTEIQVS